MSESYTLDELTSDTGQAHAGQVYSFEELTAEPELISPRFEAPPLPAATPEDLAEVSRPWYQPPPEMFEPIGGTIPAPPTAEGKPVIQAMQGVGDVIRGLANLPRTPAGLLLGGLAVVSPPAAAIVGGAMGSQMIGESSGKLSVPGGNMRETVGDIGQGLLGAATGMGSVKLLAKASGILPKSSAETAKIIAEDRGETLAKIANEYEASRAVEAGSPFVRAEAPPEVVSMGMEQGRLPPLGDVPTFEPSGARLEKTKPEQISVETPEQPDRTVQAVNALKEQAAQRQRTLDFAKSVEEMVSQEQEPPIHPDKPLTENQLRIIYDSLNEAVSANQIPGPNKGLIAGSGLEKWADDVLRGGGTHAGPDVLAAYLVKGASLIERGVTEFAKWSAAMVKEFGEKIKPQLKQLYGKSTEMRASQFGKPTQPEGGGTEVKTIVPTPGAEIQPKEVGYGIAERVRNERARAGQGPVVNPGEGIAAAESVRRGRDILSKDPAAADKAMTAFESDPNKAISAEGIAAARAKGELLAKQARDIEQKLGPDSPEYKAAFKVLSDWDQRTKPMQTEWHKAGQAQQGETDLDTGSFTGLQRAYRESTGKDFTPQKARTAKKIAADVTKSKTEAETAKNKVYERIGKELATEKKTPETDLSARIWAKARELIDKGEDNFDEIRNKIATDLGLPVKDVTTAMNRPKGAKVLSNEMWKKQQTARRLDSEAKRWLHETQMPLLNRAIANVPKVLFSMKVGFHGTVALGTHAPMVAFQPRFWKTYVQNYGKMYRMVGSRAYYEMQVQDLLRKPNYITARRAGLVNDPFQYEDFNSPEITKYFKGITQMGNRGYSVLKMLRQDMFDQHWNNLPKSTQIPEVAAAIADGVNHATGVVKVNAPKGAALALFAPRLEMSRAAWLVADPVKTANTVLNWKNASEGQKHFAINQIKEKAWVIGTAASLLALNQGVLSATGSKQKINGIPEVLGGSGFDPFKSDFLKFKVAGKTVSYGNPMLTMARLALRLWVGIENEGKLNKIIYEDENTAKTIFDYMRTQASPFAGPVMDLAFGRDFQERPLPRAGFGLLEGKTAMPKRLRAEGIEPYTWAEWGTLTALPIPFSEAMRDVWKEGFGLDEKGVSAMNKFWAIVSATPKAIIMGGTGARIYDDPDSK